MKIVLFNKKKPDPQKPVIDALYAGLKKMGFDVVMNDKAGKINYNIAACWGWRRGSKEFEKNKKVLVIEHGYMIDRHKWSSLGWNGLNNDANFLNQNVPNNRWKNLFEKHMKPWKTNGKYIILCGQVPNDKSLRGNDLSYWYKEVAKIASNKYNLPIVWRPHPLDQTGKSLQIPNTTLDIKKPLIESLENAAAIMAFNSNSLIEGIMNGIPGIAFDKGTMAWDVCTNNYKPLIRPNRDDWGRKMGYTQWTHEEIADGTAIKHIFKQYLK